MKEIYRLIDDIKHIAEKIRDFSEGEYQGMAIGLIDRVDRLIEKLEEKEKGGKL